MSEQPVLSIIIPTYNEEVNIVSTLSEVLDYMPGTGIDYEVIISDDGSTDDTVEKAGTFRARIPHLEVIENVSNRGKGYAVRRAMLTSRGKFVLFMDADSSVSIRELGKFLPLEESGAEINIASRRVPGAEVTMPASRLIMGKIYILLASLLLGTRVKDINCGFKVFCSETAKYIFSKQTRNDWSFDAEVMYIASQRGYKVREVPVKWAYRDTSKVRPIIDAIKSFWSLFSIRINAIKGIYV